jgi:hypothetical protein
MGCDYYIIRYLKVTFEDSTSFDIELERDRGYFDFYMDEDEPNYEEKYREYIQSVLSNEMKPIVIFKDKEFSTLFLENKYKLLIEEELNSFNKNRDLKMEWTNIKKIVKKESRWERD